MGKKVMIVIEETGQQPDGQGFQIYLEGVDHEKLKNLPSNLWSAAEYWGVHLFKIVTGAVNQTGALRSVTQKPKGN